MLSKLIQWFKALVGRSTGAEAPRQPASSYGQRKLLKGDEKVEAEHPDSVYPLW